MAKSDYPYVTVTNSFRKLLQELPTYGRPPKVTQKWLESVGFKSKNDRRMIPVLKFVGLIGSDGAPTDLWARYRGGTEGRAALAEAIRQAYAPLFQTFPDAQRRDSEALLNFFRANTDLAEAAARKTVTTFQILTEVAEWETDPPADLNLDVPDDDEAADGQERATGVVATRSHAVPVVGAANGMTLNINIQLQLPANADGQTYEQLFAAMGKHLKDLGGIG